MFYPTIALDLDGVVVKFHPKLIEEYNKRYEPALTVHDIDCDLESLGPEISRRLISLFNEEGFILNLEAFPDAIHTVSQFQDFKYETVICTAPARNLDGLINENSAKEKVIWIRENLPFWANELIITKRKELVAADILVDDWSFNIINWCERNRNGIGYLIDQPWNQKFKHLPPNAIRGDLTGVSSFIEKFWCHSRGRFIYRLEELQQGWNNRNKNDLENII